ncbi:ABC transporter permease [Bacillaceae bacterium SIJ1]|uniref:ABC transporter permease n=1 Tax=Litoribacterium kuwaitense TaxID=1398745 RepID=UPI0013E9DE9A|nr:ABC transporter permease [Litoribacterium kuwaitense]NGP45536.1 ABC transporter permease [Litoribacterium kuwaitense]
MLKKWRPYLLILPSIVVVILFVIYPIINAVIRSFSHSENGSFTFDNYSYFFTDPIQLENIVYTIYIAVATVIFTLLIAYPFSMYLRFSQTKISKLAFKLIFVPYLVPAMVAVYAVMLVINDAGVINRLSQLIGFDLKPGFIYNHKGIILINLWFNIPFVTLIITAALSGVKDALIESARDVGAKKLTIFRNVILPLTYKDALLAATFVFMSNVASFTTPYLVGGNAPKMLGIALFDQFNGYMAYERAAALSVIIFLISSISAIVYIYSNMKESQWQQK